MPKLKILPDETAKVKIFPGGMCGARFSLPLAEPKIFPDESEVPGKYSCTSSQKNASLSSSSDQFMLE